MNTQRKGIDFIAHKAGHEFFINELISDSNCDVDFCGMKSIRTEINRQEQVRELFLESSFCKSLAALLGYKKGLFIAQASIKHLKAALENNESAIIQDYLSDEESKRYHGFKHAKKRLEWLAGRLAAKEAVCRYFNNDALEKSLISISNLSNGCPQITMKKLDNPASIPHVSISHSGDIAIALVVQGSGAAIDIQKIEPAILEIADSFSIDREQRMLIAGVKLTQEEALTAVWAIKEASRKAAGVEACSMKELSLNKAQGNGKHVVCELYNKNTGHIKSVAFKNNDYIYSMSACLDRECVNERSDFRATD